MARPQKPLQKKKNGVWFCQVRVGKKRYTESLGTKDEQKALTLCGPVLKRLQEQADEDLVAKATRFFPDDPRIEHRIRSLINPESLPENKKIKWIDLVREHERVFKRKNPNREGLSPGWHEQMRITLREVPFTYEQTSRKRIRDWVAAMEKMVWTSGPKQGSRRLSARSIEIRCTYLSAITQTGITSGFLPDDAINHWRQVDFAAGAAAGDNHIHTATEEDYRGIGDLLRTTDVRRRIRIAILLQAYCGTRVSEIVRRQQEDWNLDASPDYGTLTIPLHKGKNRTSSRTVLIPPFLVRELKAYGFQGRPTGGGANLKIKQVNPELTTHSFHTASSA